VLLLVCAFATPAEAQQTDRLRADALRALGCLMQPDAPIRLDPQYSAADGFRVQYARNTMRFPVADGQFQTQQNLAMVVYGRDGRTAYFYKVAMEVTERPGRIGLWNASYLEKLDQQWQIIELWQGAETVYREESASLPGLLQMTMRTIPRSEVRPSGGPCWAPDSGGGYGTRFGTAGTAFLGPRIKEQLGPYDYSSGGSASSTVWMTFWEER
jgi:hypothetical protein